MARVSRPFSTSSSRDLSSMASAIADSSPSSSSLLCGTPAIVSPLIVTSLPASSCFACAFVRPDPPSGILGLILAIWALRSSACRAQRKVSSVGVSTPSAIILRVSGRSSKSRNFRVSLAARPWYSDSFSSGLYLSAMSPIAFVIACTVLRVSICLCCSL